MSDGLLDLADSSGTELLPGDGSAVLRPGFIAPSEAGTLLDELVEEIPWAPWTIAMFGRQVAEPRLSAWMGDPGTEYRYSGRTRTPQPWTPTVLAVRDRCAEVTGARFNAVLANLYRDGHDSMGWHSDDEPENGPEPTIASISLGAPRAFDLRHRTSGERVRAVLTSGSLLVMSGPCQTFWTHRVPKSTGVAGLRVNLTFRLVSGGDVSRRSSSPRT